MKHRTVVACLLGCAVALGAIAGPPTTSAASADQMLLSAAKKKTKKQRVYRPPRPTGQIACTPAGCHRIPPGCHPQPGMDFWGNPTGFDDIIC